MTNKFFDENNPTSDAVEQAIKRMDWTKPKKYRIEWASSEKWDDDSAYVVKEFRFRKEAGAKMLLLGPRGGEYLINSNPKGHPQVKKQRSDGYKEKDRLVELTIFMESSIGFQGRI